MHHHCHLHRHYQNPSIHCIIKNSMHHLKPSPSLSGIMNTSYDSDSQPLTPTRNVCLTIHYLQDVVLRLNIRSNMTLSDVITIGTVPVDSASVISSDEAFDKLASSDIMMLVGPE